MSTPSTGSGRLYWAQPPAETPAGEDERATRPSFWRRLGLDRVRGEADTTPASVEAGGSFPNPIRALEQRLVAPMLESLAGVEAKLERSHRDVLEAIDRTHRDALDRCDLLENELASVIEEKSRDARAAEDPDPIEEIRRV